MALQWAGSPRGHISGNKNPIDAGLEFGQGCKALFLCHMRRKVYEQMEHAWEQGRDQTREEGGPKAKGNNKMEWERGGKCLLLWIFFFGGGVLCWMC